MPTLCPLLYLGYRVKPLGSEDSDLWESCINTLQICEKFFYDQMLISLFEFFILR